MFDNNALISTLLLYRVSRPILIQKIQVVLPYEKENNRDRRLWLYWIPYGY